MGSTWTERVLKPKPFGWVEEAGSTETPSVGLCGVMKRCSSERGSFARESGEYLKEP